MSDDPTAMRLRAKILGALIRAERLKAGKSIQEIANATGIRPEAFEKYELGENAISLPELEMIAYFLGVPLERFLEKEAQKAPDDAMPQSNPLALVRLRHRVIGTILRQARLEKGLSLEELSNSLNIEASELEAYEFGLEPVPLPTLEALCGKLGRSLREFLDQKGPIGQWNASQRALQDFMNMPLELQAFISKPINRPYLDLAIRLSEMSVDRLRAVAEGLLEITY